ncbi:M1 family aminopeptidase [Chryseolinea lacunae]|uniref:Peptidase M1 n=1 Tax=Chryseolinea lacunae TaxID=2801331 RepID=A0ABS1KYX2_9BACT|nr:M1 family aminopeptidase [Chryseolinea lacunae]MBL0743887.1 peptidase M1 [Chryseolinea lacunae]
MFWKIFLFEIRYRMKRPATWAYFGIIFVLACLLGYFGSSPASEKAYVNSSTALGEMTLVLSLFEVFLASAVMGVPVYRDIEYRTKDYFFTYPIGEKSYLMGRFWGSFLILLLITFAFPLGLLIGGPVGLVAGEIEPERYGPFVFYHYFYNTVVLSIPNLFFAAAVFFSLVALTRKIAVTYMTSVLLFVGYLLANALTRDLDNKTLVDILDPFALTTYNNATKYWTPAEQNVNLIPLSGNFLWNRVLWIGISLALFVFTYFRFSFRSMLATSSGALRKEESTERIGRALVDLPVVQKVYSSSIFLRKMLRLAILEFKFIAKDFYFIAILLAGVLFLFLDGWFGSPIYGTPSLPLTYYMLEVKDYDYVIFVFIIFIFYTGEVVHRDKSVNYANIADALPVPNWVIYGAKFIALLLISFLLVNLVLVCGVMNQVAKGYFNFEFGMYFTDLYLIEFPEYVELVMLSFIVHILVNNKFMGHVVSIGIWVLLLGLRNFADMDYNLLFYSYAPNYMVSDMNGFGHFLRTLTIFHIYWLSLGAVFIVIGNLFWNRGSESSFKARWMLARSRFNIAPAVALTFFTLLWLGTGAFIYYNVSVLNTYRTSKESKQISADFEKKYKKYEFMAQPKVTDVNATIDIFPKERRTVAAARFTVVNKSTKAIDSLLLNIGSPIRQTRIETLTLNEKPLTLLMEDKVNRFYIYKLPATLNPGDTAVLSVQMDARSEGFANSGLDREVVYNGTFFDLNVFPSFGYPGDPMTSDKDRKKYGLPKKDYVAPPQTDPLGLSTLLFNDDADYVTFQATISTDADQLAIAPGYIQKEWTENGRKFYHYTMDAPMDLFFNLSSARYAVKRDHWKGAHGDTVNIEIFYHPTHAYNLDRFVKSAKASLDYFTSNFGPYQYRQIRILEFPRYAGFAQSFPNTVPYTESFGWVADYSDPDDTDYTFYVTAHEIAHQWWGHQVTPSFTRGANQLSESMAEYSSLMVLQKEYGKDAMQKRLKYALDRYLRGRAGEDKFEATLLDNDSRAYVWYDKGSLILYGLQDLIGEDTLNHAFQKFLDTAAFRQKPPFPTSNEWYSYIKAATPDSLHYYIEDGFEKIALYENRITKADYKKLEGDKYKVTLTVQTKKLYYDGLGKETGAGTGKDLVDIGIFAEEGKAENGMKKKTPLYLKKHWLTPGEHTLEFEVTGKPIKAGIDPYNKLIDRIPDDNIKTVDEL